MRQKKLPPAKRVFWTSEGDVLEERVVRAVFACGEDGRSQLNLTRVAAQISSVRSGYFLTWTTRISGPLGEPRQHFGLIH